MAFKIGGKEMYLASLFSQCCWSVHSTTVVALGKHARSVQRKATPAQTPTVSCQVCVHVLLVQHLYSVFFQLSVWYGPTSEPGWVQRRHKYWSKYADFMELKKITSRIYSNCSNYSSFLFKVLHIPLLFVLFHSKTFTVNYTSVLLILLITL